MCVSAVDQFTSRSGASLTLEFCSLVDVLVALSPICIGLGDCVGVVGRDRNGSCLRHGLLGVVKFLNLLSNSSPSHGSVLLLVFELLLLKVVGVLVGNELLTTGVHALSHVYQGSTDHFLRII